MVPQEVPLLRLRLLREGRGPTSITPATPTPSSPSSALRRERARGAAAPSVFFGGGTPSLWAPSELGRVLAACWSAAGQRGDGASRSPSSATRRRSTRSGRARCVDEGVNRLSVGVQGLDPERLALPRAAARRRRRARRGRGGAAVGDAAGQRRPHLRASPTGAGGRRARDQAAARGRPRRGDRRDARVGVQPDDRARAPSSASSRASGRLPIAPDDAVAEAFFAIEAALEARGLRPLRDLQLRAPGRRGAAQPRLLARDGLPRARLRRVRDDRRRRGARGPLPQRARSGALREGARSAAELAALVESEEPLDPETRLRERIMLGLRLRDGFDLEGSARELGVAAWTDERRRAADEARRARGSHGGGRPPPPARRALGSTPTGSPRRSSDQKRPTNRAAVEAGADRRGRRHLDRRVLRGRRRGLRACCRSASRGRRASG